MNSSSGTIAVSNLRLHSKLCSDSEPPADQPNMSASEVRGTKTPTHSVLLNQPDKQKPTNCDWIQIPRRKP